jgi:hypothetical protein
MKSFSAGVCFTVLIGLADGQDRLPQDEAR